MMKTWYGSVLLNYTVYIYSLSVGPKYSSVSFLGLVTIPSRAARFRAAQFRAAQYRAERFSAGSDASDEKDMFILFFISSYS